MITRLSCLSDGITVVMLFWWCSCSSSYDGDVNANVVSIVAVYAVTAIAAVAAVAVVAAMLLLSWLCCSCWCNVNYNELLLF